MSDLFNTAFEIVFFLTFNIYMGPIILFVCLGWLWLWLGLRDKPKSDDDDADDDPDLDKVRG